MIRGAALGTCGRVWGTEWQDGGASLGHGGRRGGPSWKAAFRAQAGRASGRLGCQESADRAAGMARPGMFGVTAGDRREVWVSGHCGDLGVNSREEPELGKTWVTGPVR